MRYMKPTITSYSAFAVVKSEKGDFVQELNQILLTDGPAYQSVE
jgi:hypothetical protein